MQEAVHTLVVDDEEAICFFLKEALQKAGHTVTIASSGEGALELLRETPFELIILDLMLGSAVNGQRILEAVRWRWPDTVVVILTAHGSLQSAMTAIAEGVDGYLLKPVEPDDLLRTVQKALDRQEKLSDSRASARDSHLLRRGPFVVDLEKRVATLGEHSLALNPSEFALLVHLMQNARKVISPQDLVRVVRQYDSEYPYEAQQIIKWYIHRLRHKVEPDPANPRYILNVRGAGYMFEA
jgi:DNA-binding response OmpR family regulator